MAFKSPCRLICSFPPKSKSSLCYVGFEKLACCKSRQKSSAQLDAKIEECRNTQTYDQGRPFSEIPGPPAYPVIGTWLGYKRYPERIHQRHIYLQQLKEQYGGIVKEKFHWGTVIHLLSPDYFRQVLEAEGKLPMVPPLLPFVQYYRKTKDMAPGLGNSNGEEWYNLRSVVQKILMKPQKTLDYLYLQNEAANSFIEKLESLVGYGGEVENLSRWICRWGLTSSLNTFFEMNLGYLEEPGCKEADKIVQCNGNVFEMSTKLYFGLNFPRILPSPSVEKLFEDEDYVNSIVRRLLNEASKSFRDELEGRSNHGKQYLFLKYMLSSKSISDLEIFAVVNSMVMDTLSTTSQALLFTLFMLATHPDIQEKVHQEAVAVSPESSDVTAHTFNSSTYIKAFMRESLRIFPVGLDIQRFCPADMVIGGYQVPKDTYLSLDLYVPNHDPEHIPNPEAFLPERWVRGSDVYKKLHPFVSIPFSVGTRMCAGRRFAEQDMVIMISKMLRKFKLEWHHEEMVGQRHRLLQVPDREVRIKFVPRAK